MEKDNCYLGKKRLFTIQKVDEKFPRGRKTKGDNSERKNNKYIERNYIKKGKNNAYKSIIYTIKMILQNSKKKKSLKVLSYELIIDGTKNFNIQFLKSKIWEILTFDYDKDYQIHNEKILSDCLSNNLIMKILNISFIDYISTDFLLSNEEYNKKYELKKSNKFLLENYKDEKEKNLFKELIQSNLLEHFSKKRTKKVKHEKYSPNPSKKLGQLIIKHLKQIPNETTNDTTNETTNDITLNNQYDTKDTIKCLLYTLSRLSMECLKEIRKKFKKDVYEHDLKEHELKLNNVENYKADINKSIKVILKKEYETKNKESYELIEEYSKTNKLVKEILNMKFSDFENSIFKMSKEEFDRKYPFPNDYLLTNIKKKINSKVGNCENEDKKQLFYEKIPESNFILKNNEIKDDLSKSNEINDNNSLFNTNPLQFQNNSINNQSLFQNFNF